MGIPTVAEPGSSTNLREFKDLKLKALGLRKTILEIMGVGTVGHLASSSSIIDILTALYFHHMRLDPTNPRWEGRDRFILSKGHASYALYAVLMELGYISKDEIPNKKKIGSVLQTHPDMKKTPGVEANTGSLGQGLSIGLGLCLGFRLSGGNQRVFVLVGDGELGEGPIWEAAMAASHYKTDKLRVIVDQNGQSSTGFTKERFYIHSVRDKFASFGCNSIEIDGHDFSQILEAFELADNTLGRPTAIIANTTKGKGFPFAENNPNFHHAALTQELYDSALKMLEDAIEAMESEEKGGHHAN
ncbi:MAG: transketolase [Spirochaetales bacterium]